MTVRMQHHFIGDLYPLDHPRIGWQSHAGTVDVSGAAAGFPGVDALDPRTITAWRPDSTAATWTLTFAEPKRVSYVGIGAHDLGSSGCSVGISLPDGLGGFVPVPGLSGVPDDNGAIMALMQPVTVSAVRIVISDPGGATAPTIAHIRAGDVMEWPQRAQFTGLPITEARQIDYEFNQSQTGEWQGMTIKRRGLEFSATVQHLSEQWTDEVYAPFRNYADTGQPFFYAARPSKYAREVAYCFASSLVQSERDMPNYRISRDVQMNLRGYARNG